MAWARGRLRLPRGTRTLQGNISRRPWDTSGGSTGLICGRGLVSRSARACAGRASGAWRQRSCAWPATSTTPWARHLRGTVRPRAQSNRSRRRQPAGPGRSRAHGGQRPLLSSRRRKGRWPSWWRGGATNKEAARALFVAEKTVQYHLTRLYRKMGIRSRSELAAAFRAKESPGAHLLAGAYLTSEGCFASGTTVMSI